MLKTTEFQGKTVEDALVNASISLGVPKNEINYEIITYGSTGIFGLIGAKKAAIKVLIYETNKKQNSQQLDPSLQKKVSIKTIKEKTTSDDGLKIGMAVLRRIVDSITDTAKIEVLEEKHQQVVFEIKAEGNASGILIGKKGQTLEAMQYIVEKIVNKNTNKRLRIMIDVEGYLGKKRENLQKLATKMLAKVRRTKKPVTIGQMNAYDRRIVHTHLKSEYNIKTQSIGSGYYRKIMIFPTKNR